MHRNELFSFTFTKQDILCFPGHPTNSQGNHIFSLTARSQFALMFLNLYSFAEHDLSHVALMFNCRRLMFFQFPLLLVLCLFCVINHLSHQPMFCVNVLTSDFLLTLCLVLLLQLNVLTDIVQNFLHCLFFSCYQQMV